MRLAAYLALGLCLTAGGCAGGPADPRPIQAFAPDQGLSIAQQRCAICHALNEDDGRPRAAPPFATIARRHTPLSLERQLTALKNGHYEMPPLRLSPEEVRRLADYIESLG